MLYDYYYCSVLLVVSMHSFSSSVNELFHECVRMIHEVSLSVFIFALANILGMWYVFISTDLGSHVGKSGKCHSSKILFWEPTKE